MKPLDFTKPITTRDGRKVRILCTDGPNKSWPVVGYIDDSTIETHWQLNGYFDGNLGDERDLINPPIKRKVEFWVNVYFDDLKQSITQGDTHKTKDGADLAAANTLVPRIACLHFTREYEEGEGL